MKKKTKVLLALFGLGSAFLGSFLFARKAIAGTKMLPSGTYNLIIEVQNAITLASISSATVTVNGASQTTDVNGEVEFYNIAAGSYGISVKASNYSPQSTTVTITPGSGPTYLITIHLTPS